MDPATNSEQTISRPLKGQGIKYLKNLSKVILGLHVYGKFKDQSICHNVLMLSSLGPLSKFQVF